MLRNLSRRLAVLPCRRISKRMAHQVPGTSSAGKYNDNDWDIIPKVEWTHDMCVRWLRDEVLWSDKDIKLAGRWLEMYAYPGKHLITTEVKDKLPNIPVNALDNFEFALERLKPPGRFAEPLKRWAELVAHPEQKIQSIEEYHNMKNSGDRVMVLSYSDLLKSEEDEEALKELRKEVLATEIRLSQLRGECAEEATTKAEDVLGDLEARVLPAHLAWPCFFVGKQVDGAQNTHVLLRRQRLPAQNMETDAIEKFKNHEFRKSSKVLWLGAAGVGKSSYASVIAEKLVRNMNSYGNPSLVAFRIDDCLYYITCPQPGAFRVETVTLQHVDELIKISYSIMKRNGVLIFELTEKEICPAIVCHMLSSSSVKDANQVFMEQMKMGNTSIYYISPYEVWEVRAAAKLLYHLNEDQQASKMGVDDFAKRALERYNKVGGLPRYIFQTDDMYETREQRVSQHFTASDFFATLRKNDPLMLTSSAKYIIAPLSISSTSWRYGVKCARIRFVYLSEYCERKVIEHLSPNNLNKLRGMREQFGDWLTEEMLLFASLLQHMSSTDISMFKAEWYKDPGNGTLITSECEKDDTFVKSMHPCSYIIHLNESICTTRVSELKEMALYRNTPNVAMTVADCFVVDHVNRRLWLFNNGIIKANEHPFKICNLRYIRDIMRVKDDDYTIHLCYVRSSHRGGDVGLVFTEGGKKAKLPDDLKDVYRFYVVRIHYEGIGSCVNVPNATKVEEFAKAVL